MIKDSAQINNALLEILLHMGNSFEIKEVANEALTSYVQQLDLAGIVLYEKQHNNYVVHTCKPKNLKSNTTISEIINTVVSDIDNIEKEYFSKDIPYSTSIDQTFYYIYKLKEFGFLMFIKNNTALTNGIHKALKQLHLKFANSLIACNNVTKLREQDRQILEAIKMAQMSEMIGNIAHQWRQPLSAISSIASGLQVQKTLGLQVNNDDLNEAFDDIIKNTKFLSQIIDDFRNFIKEEKALSPINIKDLILRTISIIRSTIKHLKIDINIEIEDDCIFEGIEDEISQVIINLTNNSIDALSQTAQEHKLINIEAYKLDDTIILKISDNGDGIPKDILPKIFDPYFTTKHQAQGTGISLYMSKKIIEKHHSGKLTALNSDTKGAVFIIELPLKKLD